MIPGRLFCATCLLFALVACSPKPQQPEIEFSPQSDMKLMTFLAGNLWVAQSIHGDPVKDKSHISMVFGTRKVSGNGGCNAYSATYVLKDGKVTFSSLAKTLRMCSPAVNEQESSFFEMLRAPQTLRFKKGLLYLVPEDDKPSIFAMQRWD